MSKHSDIAKASPDQSSILAVSDTTKHYIRESISKNTKRAYASDLRAFRFWCEENKLAFPIITSYHLADYLSFLAHTHKPSTLNRKIAAIKYYYYINQNDQKIFSDPVLLETLKGIRRDKGIVQNKKKPITNELLKKMIENIPDSFIGCRNKALLLIGFAGAFRRSELINIQLNDLSFNESGLVVKVRKSKTDQEGKGRAVAILKGNTCCPVEAISRWITLTNITSGFVFRRSFKSGRLSGEPISSQTVSLIVKHYIGLIGEDNTEYSAHSLRRGFLTSAAQNHADIFKMMAVSGHRSLDTLKEYIDDAQHFVGHAGAGLL